MTDEERDNLLRKLDEKTDKIVEHITKIDTILFDVNGYDGLCSRIISVEKRVIANRNFLIVLALTIGTSLGGFIKGLFS